MKKLTHASLFSGIGGFDLAAHWMNWKNTFTCEINEWCTHILKYYYPNSVHYADIKKTDFIQWRGKIDILTGGFPCQPFSVAGQRKGAEDNRYLWPEFIRAIREIRPTWIIGENVTGILTMVQPGKEIELENQTSLFEEKNLETLQEQDFIIETICKDIEAEGYSVQPITIPACAIGAPHRRERVWIIANCNHRQFHEQEKEIQTVGNTLKSSNKNAPDTKCKGSGQIYKEIQSKQPDGNRINSSSHQRDVTNADTKRLERNFNSRKQPQKRENNDFWSYSSRLYKQDKWQNFPTQPPVCCGNDGISTRLDGITFSKWRTESIKAYGNTIVPQIAFEIYKAIEYVNETYNE